MCDKSALFRRPNTHILLNLLTKSAQKETNMRLRRTSLLAPRVHRSARTATDAAALRSLDLAGRILGPGGGRFKWLVSVLSTSIGRKWFSYTVFSLDMSGEGFIAFFWHAYQFIGS